MKPWSTEERERLRCLWNSDLPGRKIAELLDRSVSSVTTQAAVLRNAGEPLEWRHPNGRAR